MVMVLSSPDHRPRRRLLSAMAALGFFVILLFVAERDFSSVAFAVACFGLIACVTFALCSRIAFALTFALSVMVASAIISLVKFKFMGINAHAFDLYFFFKNPDTALYLVNDFWRISTRRSGTIREGLVLLAGLCCLAGFLFVVFKSDQRIKIRWSALVLAALALFFASAISLPAGANNVNYYFDNHFVTSFFASFSELPKVFRANPLQEHIIPAQPLERGQQCISSKSRPDIIIVLSESALPPGKVPGWKYDNAIDARFHSYDGQIHKLRVETFGSGTWITATSLLSGLSMADTGWMRSYVPIFLKDKIHDALPDFLRACGYKTALISPEDYAFVNEGPMYSSMGIDTYLDRSEIAAASWHESDDFYFSRAFDYIAKQHQTNDQPLFVFIMTMAGHSPYDFMFKPERIVSGMPFGNTADVDEYLRRSTMAQDDFATFVEKLRQAGFARPILVAQFGDHQPPVTLQDGINPYHDRGLSDWRSRLYETFYSVIPINMGPVSSLPQLEVLDIAFLGVTVLESAGLQLDPVYLDKRTLRDACGGAFHTCKNRALVDEHLSRLASGKLIGPFDD
jgi:phosphoglycerol transferase MdoB-like AlkP superfamily enzyme